MNFLFLLVLMTVAVVVITLTEIRSVRKQFPLSYSEKLAPLVRSNSFLIVLFGIITLMQLVQVIRGAA